MQFEKNLYVFRNARLDEVVRLAEIETVAEQLFVEHGIFTELNGETFPADELAELIAENSVWVAATVENDVAVGFIILTTLGDNAHVEELDVLPEFGQCGLGAALLEHACGRAAERGFHAVTLSTFRDVPWNAPFYQKRNFRNLDAVEFTPEMIRLREIEDAKGLPVDRRVVMIRQLFRN